MKFLLHFFLLYFITINAYANHFSLTSEEEAWLNAQKNISLSTSIAIPNFSMINDQGELTGLLYDYFNLISQKINKPITFKPFQEGRYSAEKVMKMDDVYGHTALFENKKNRHLYLLTNPYMRTPIIVFTSKKSQSEIKSLADLQGKKLAVLQPLANLDFLENYKNIKLSRVSNRISLLNQVQYGNVDAIIGGIGFHHLIKENLYTNIVPAFNIENSAPIVIGIKPQYPLLVSILNKAINSIPKSAILALSEKWFTNIDNTSSWSAEEQAYIKTHPVLKVPNFKTFPPFNFNENGTPMGYSIDYLNLMANYIGVKIEYIQDKTWSQAVEMLKTGDIDIIPHIAKTKERQKFIDYSDFIHVEYTTALATRTESNINSIEDLKDKTIAVTSQSFVHSYLQKNYPDQKLLLTNSTSSGVEAVASGTADAVIGSLPAMHYFIQKSWLSNIKVVSLHNLATTTELSMGVTKGNKTLLSILNKTHALIPKTQESRLKEKWINPPTKDSNSIKLTEEELSYLTNKKEIKLCINSNWPPFESLNKGKHVGIVADYFDIFQKSLITPITLVKTNSFQAAIEVANKGQCDIVSVLPEIQNNSDHLSLSTPYINTSIVIATKGNTPFIDDLHSLQNKRIGIIDNCFCQQALQDDYPNLNLISVSSAQEGLQKVSDKAVFGFIGSFPVVAPLIQDRFIGDLKIAGKLESSRGFSMGIRNDEPNLLHIFNKLINRIPATTNQKIMNKFVTLKIKSSIDYTKLLYVSGIFLLIIIAVLYRNRAVKSMNRKLKTAYAALTEQQEMVNKYVLIVETDCFGVITNVNDAYCHCLGFKKDELIGKSHKALRHPKMNDSFFQDMWRAINQNKTWSGEMLNYTKNKETKYFTAYIDPILNHDKKIGYRAICEDITDKKRVEELSITDKLTGIYNRLKLDQLITKQVNSFKRYNLAFSVIIIDIDNFKMVNDTYGHDIGDRVLQQLSASMCKRIRSTDFVGRWGGEEFLIICPNTIANKALILAEYIRTSIEQEHFDEVETITLSLGVTEFFSEDTVTSVFKRADKALYQAKNAGKNQSVVL